jgi:hypothetical protein
VRNLDDQVVSSLKLKAENSRQAEAAAGGRQCRSDPRGPGQPLMLVVDASVAVVGLIAAWTVATTS